MAVTAQERRIVTVLLADVVGSTAIGEKLGPERSKFLIDEVMRIMSEQVRRYDGTVAQLVGDELLAFFGAPVSYEDDSERAVRAALAIQRAIAQYAEEVKDAYGVDLAVRIGINTGPVIIGSQSEDGQDGYDPWNALGDTVNVASRLQEVAGDGGVVIGPTTMRQVESCFEVSDLGLQNLKGVGEPVAGSCGRRAPATGTASVSSKGAGSLTRRRFRTGPFATFCANGSTWAPQPPRPASVSS